MTRTTILLAVLLLTPLRSHGGDIAREMEYAEWVKRSVKVGEVVSLQQNGRPFLAIHTKALAAEPLGTAIILHDRNGFPNHNGVVRALRTTLPQHRWNTVALQMPLRENGAGESEYYALFPESKARLKACLAYLQESGEGNIVVIGYGLGALMGLHGIGEDGQPVAALVAISLPVPDTGDEHAQTLAFLEKLRVPVLDIYAGNDLPAVVDSARKRKQAAAGNPDFRQDRLLGAGHSFRHEEMLLTKRVYSWLRRGFADR